MAAHGFPVFPGSEALENKENIDELARGIGFPLVVKPSGGGGGIGMQVVSHPQDLSVAIARASSIAEKLFLIQVYILKSGSIGLGTLSFR